MRKNKSSRAVICLDIDSESIKLVKGLIKDGKICILDFASRTYASEEMTPYLISRHIQEMVSAAEGRLRSWM